MTTTIGGSRSRPARRPARPDRADPERPQPKRADPPDPPDPPESSESVRPTREAPDPGRAFGPRRGAPRAPFVVLIVALLSGALVSLLLLNTVLAEDAFELTRLQRNVKQLQQQKQAMEYEIAREESPERLARKAENLGMTQPTQVAFIDPHTRRVVGGGVRPVPHTAAAAAGAAGALGLPGVVVPGDGVAVQQP